MLDEWGFKTRRHNNQIMFGGHERDQYHNVVRGVTSVSCWQVVHKTHEHSDRRKEDQGHQDEHTNGQEIATDDAAAESTNDSCTDAGDAVRLQRPIVFPALVRAILTGVTMEVLPVVVCHLQSSKCDYYARQLAR